MKRVIVSVTNDLVTDNRVDRTCNLLHSYGFNVVLVGRIRKNSQLIKKRKYITKRFRLIFQKGPFFYAEYNFRLFLYLLFNKVDLLYSNDLDTLLANYCAKKIKLNAKLIYDAHELFTEVPELNERKLIKKIWTKIEEWIFPKLDKIITVNQSIAEVYFEKYKKKLLVIRNVPSKLIEKTSVSRAELGLPEDKFILIIQGSGLNIQRGIEEAILAMHLIEKCLMLIIGDGDVIPSAIELVKNEKLDEKVKFLSKRPYNEMMQFTKNADIGLSLDKPLSTNYKLALPNKVFDYIQAGIPIISSNLIEIRKIIEKYKIGFCIQQVTPDNIANQVNFIIDNPEILNEYKLNCIRTAEIENWENEKLKLENLLDNMY